MGGERGVVEEKGGRCHLATTTPTLVARAGGRAMSRTDAARYLVASHLSLGWSMMCVFICSLASCKVPLIAQQLSYRAMKRE